MRPVSLFVYGSLLAPQVLRALLDREPPVIPARLPDYRRSALRGQPFPGLVPAADAVTDGGVIHVSPRELHCLDAWEDDFFCRTAVTVRLGRDGALRTQVYLLAPAHRPLLSNRAWQPQRFIARLAPVSAHRARRWRRDRDRSLRHTSGQSSQP